MENLQVNSPHRPNQNTMNQYTQTKLVQPANCHWIQISRREQFVDKDNKF